MNNVKKIIILMVIAAVSLLHACNKDERVVAPTISNEGLTTVQLGLTNTTVPTDTASATWEQLLDNNGDPLPINFKHDTLRLHAGKTYYGELLLYDKSQSPVFDVAAEIEARSNYHLFFYQPLATKLPLVIPNNYPTDAGDVYPEPIPTPVPDQAPLNLTVTITDHDSNTPSLPLGLQTTFQTREASTGWLRIVLRHQPNQKNGTYTPGSTDLDIAYVVIIK